MKDEIMRFNRVLLVSPAYSRYFFSIPVLPTGLGYLAESLSVNNIEYSVLDMSLGYSFRDLKSRIDEFKPDLIAISSMSYMLSNTYGMITALKNDLTSLKIVIGGPHVSSIREKVMDECKDIDFAIAGEGERSLIELCQGKQIEEIRGLIYREDGGVIFHGLRDFISDLDNLGFPKYRGFELKKYGYGIGIVGSRGCPYSCIYCSCNVIGKKIRFRSVESIVDEIDYWYKQGYHEFGFQEDNPTFDRDRMFKLCRVIQERFSDLRLMCGNGVRADRVDRALLVAMKKAGFKRLAFGIESGSDKVLKAIKKGATVETMDKAISEASELKFFISLFFLVGSPQETADDVNKSIRLALKYQVQCVDFFNLVPMPGSELYNWVKENKYFVRSPNEYLNAAFHPARSVDPIFETPEFSRSERRKMLKKTQKITMFIKRRTLESRFYYLGIMGKLIFRIYCSKPINRIENKLLSNEFLRNTMGKLRMQIRNQFY